MKLWFHEAFGYAAASACALLVDMAILFTLVRYFSWWYLAAASVSFTVGIFVAYVLSVTLVFKHRRLEDRRIEFATFAVIGAIGLALNAAVIFACVRYLGLNYLVAKCIAASVTFICNFLSRRHLLFMRRSAA